jgi:small nuclear ribonucleoprotein (snRNP)-like protein
MLLQNKEERIETNNQARRNNTMDNERIRPSRQTTVDGPDKKIESPTQEDRIVESLAISVPPAKVPKPNPALALYRNQRLRLLLTDGVVMNGKLKGTQWDFLRLEGVEEIGKDYRLTADWCAVKSDSVVRVYPGNARVETTSNGGA